MATTANAEEGISLMQSCNADNTDEEINSVRRSQVTHQKRFKMRWSFRSISSSTLLIILAWGFLVHCSIAFTTYKIKSSFRKVEGDVLLWVKEWRNVIYLLILSIAFPMAILLAEVVIGRYKLTKYTLWLLWMFSIVGAVLSLCESYLSISSNMQYNLQIFSSGSTHLCTAWGIFNYCSPAWIRPAYRWIKQ
jgi:hypothetical protein